MTTIRGTQHRHGGSAGTAGAGGGGRTVDVRQLDAESQRAHELLKGLADAGDVAGRQKLLHKAGVKEPLTPATLVAVARCLAQLDLPLTPVGIARFKADRGLVGGNALAGPVARAYARAIDGGEVLFRVDRKEEAELRPGDKAALEFLRQLARGAGAEAVGRLKEALGLGNPPSSTPEAQALMNEYVGVHTVREVARVTALHRVALTSLAVKEFVVKLEAEKAAGRSTTQAPGGDAGVGAAPMMLGKAFVPVAGPGRGPRRS
jgi:hypothetical protein